MRREIIKIVVMVVMCVAAMPGMVNADLLTIAPTYDVTTSSHIANQTQLLYVGVYYGYEYLPDGSWQSTTTKSYIQYDLAALTALLVDPTVVINSISVGTQLTPTLSGDPFDMGLFSVADDNWNSGSVTWAGGPSGIALLDESVTPGSWTPVGAEEGSYMTIFDSASLASFVLQEESGDGTASFLISPTSDLTAQANYPANRVKQFYTTGSDIPENALMLNVDYSVIPEPAAVVILGLGSLGGILLKRKK